MRFFVFIVFFWITKSSISTQTISSIENIISVSAEIYTYKGEEKPSNCAELEFHSLESKKWKKKQTKYTDPVSLPDSNLYMFNLKNEKEKEISFFLPFFFLRSKQISLCQRIEENWKSLDSYALNEKFPIFEIAIPANSSSTFYFVLSGEDLPVIDFQIFSLKSFLFLMEIHAIFSNLLFLSYIFFLIWLLYKIVKEKKGLYLWLGSYSVVIFLFTLYSLGIGKSFFYNSFFSDRVFFFFSLFLFLGFCFYFCKDFIGVYFQWFFRFIFLTSFALILFSYYDRRFLPYFSVFLFLFLLVLSLRIVGLGFEPQEWILYSLIVLFIPGLFYILFVLKFFPLGFLSYMILPALFIQLIILCLGVQKFYIFYTQKNSVFLETENSIQLSYKKSHIQKIDIEKKILHLKVLMEKEKVFLDEDFRSGDLAALLGLTPHQLSELLSQAMGTHFYRLIQEYRIREAMEILIRDTEKNILSVGFEVGFQSKSAFNTVFKKITGKTPAEFRKEKVKQ